MSLKPPVQVKTHCGLNGGYSSNVFLSAEVEWKYKIVQVKIVIECRTKWSGIRPISEQHRDLQERLTGSWKTRPSSDVVLPRVWDGVTILEPGWRRWSAVSSGCSKHWSSLSLRGCMLIVPLLLHPPSEPRRLVWNMAVCQHQLTHEILAIHIDKEMVN